MNLCRSIAFISVDVVRSILMLTANKVTSSFIGLREGTRVIETTRYIPIGESSVFLEYWYSVFDWGERNVGEMVLLATDNLAFALDQVLSSVFTRDDNGETDMVAAFVEEKADTSSHVACRSYLSTNNCL